MKESISVITICYNNLSELIRTCQSVDEQSVHPEEHLIIDGSTNNEIIDWLQNIEQPSYRRWIHERDKGISDAFNKGVKNARFDIIQFLNSGDIYFDKNILQIVFDTFALNTNIKWCHGKMLLQRGGSSVIIGKPFEKEKLYRGMRSVFHPTMFVRKQLFNKYGLFDDSLTIAMDYDFLLRISKEDFTFIPTPLISFDPHGISNKKYLDSLKETRECYERYNGKSFKLQLWQIRLKILHYLLQSSIGKFLYKAKRGLGLENI